SRHRVRAALANHRNATETRSKGTCVTTRSVRIPHVRTMDLIPRP
ncbi:uncharacterized protein METZ01_LOCUS231442, partial [marine metagenome]